MIIEKVYAFGNDKVVVDAFGDGDGGIDYNNKITIRKESDGAIIKGAPARVLMVLIECKRYDRKNHVGVQLVRSLLGVQTDRKANKGVLITSSTFTRSAREFAERQQHYISLVDFDDLLRMMEG